MRGHDDKGILAPFNGAYAIVLRTFARFAAQGSGDPRFTRMVSVLVPGYPCRVVSAAPEKGTISRSSGSAGTEGRAP